MTCRGYLSDLKRNQFLHSSYSYGARSVCWTYPTKLFSRATFQVYYLHILSQMSVTCNGQYHRHNQGAMFIQLLLWRSAWPPPASNGNLRPGRILKGARNGIWDWKTRQGKKLNLVFPSNVVLKLIFDYCNRIDKRVTLDATGFISTVNTAYVCSRNCNIFQPADENLILDNEEER